MVDVKMLESEIRELGVPKTVLANKCGVTTRTLDNWLNNPELISAKNAKALADALRINDAQKVLAIFFADNAQKM
jgi:hypothetical protein